MSRRSLVAGSSQTPQARTPEQQPLLGQDTDSDDTLSDAVKTYASVDVQAVAVIDNYDDVIEVVADREFSSGLQPSLYRLH